MQVFDKLEREIAERIGQDFPDWLVMWGVGSRRFWAYPGLQVPRGTIAEAANPAHLVAAMRSIQHAAKRAVTTRAR